MAGKLTTETYVGEYFVKSANVVLASRIFSSSSERRPSKWFLLEIDELESVRRDVEPWRKDHTAPMVIEIYMQPWSQLGVVQGGGAGCSSTSGEMLLERWTLQYNRLPGEPATAGVASMRSVTDETSIYKRMIITIRSLFSYTRVLPAHRIFRACKRHNGTAFAMQHRVLRGTPATAAAAASSARNTLKRFEFAPIQCPNGYITTAVEYQCAATIHILEHTTTAQPAAPRIITDYIGSSNDQAQSAPSSRALRPSMSSSVYEGMGRGVGLPLPDPSSSPPISTGAGILRGSRGVPAVVRHSWSSRHVPAHVVQGGFNGMGSGSSSSHAQRSPVGGSTAASMGVSGIGSVSMSPHGAPPGKPPIPPILSHGPGMSSSPLPDAVCYSPAVRGRQMSAAAVAAAAAAQDRSRTQSLAIPGAGSSSPGGGPRSLATAMSVSPGGHGSIGRSNLSRASSGEVDAPWAATAAARTPSEAAAAVAWQHPLTGLQPGAAGGAVDGAGIAAQSREQMHDRTANYAVTAPLQPATPFAIQGFELPHSSSSNSSGGSSGRHTSGDAGSADAAAEVQQVVAGLANTNDAGASAATAALSSSSSRQVSAPVVIPGPARHRARSVADLANLAEEQRDAQSGAGFDGGDATAGGSDSGPLRPAMLQPVQKQRGAFTPSSAPAAPRGMLGQLLNRSTPPPMLQQRRGPSTTSIIGGVATAAAAAAPSFTSSPAAPQTPPHYNNAAAVGAAAAAATTAFPASPHDNTNNSANSSHSTPSRAAAACTPARYTTTSAAATAIVPMPGSSACGSSVPAGTPFPSSSSPNLPFAFTPSAQSLASMTEHHAFVHGARALPPHTPVSGRDISALATIRRPSWSSRSSSLDVSAAAATAALLPHYSPSPGSAGGAADFLESSLLCSSTPRAGVAVGGAGGAHNHLLHDSSPASSPMVAPHNAGIAPLPRSRTIPHELEPAFSMMGGHEESESDILPFALDTEGMTAPGGGQGSLHQTLLQPSPSTGAATAAPLVLQLHSKATPPPPGGAAASAHGQAMLNIAGVSCYQERDAAVGAFIRTLQSAPQLQLQPTARGNSLPVTVGQALAQVSELTQRMQLRLQASR